MSRAPLFLALAIVGLIAQAVVVGVFLGEEGLDLAEFGNQAVDTTIAVLALTDLLITGVVFLAWLPGEAARAGVERWWAYALAGLFGGLCFGLPLFLWARERRLAGRAAA